MGLASTAMTSTPATEQVSAQATQDDAAIRLVDVHKSFGSIKAVDGLNLVVPRGICLGLLGPNGAGKSTTMRMLTGQAIPDSGTIEVLGLPVPERSKEARSRMGVVPQQDNLNVELTCEQELNVWAALQRIHRHDRPAAVDRALGIAGLLDRRDSVVDTLSGGMKRRLLIARGLVQRGWDIVSTGGTARALAAAGVPVRALYRPGLAHGLDEVGLAAGAEVLRGVIGPA